MRAVADTNTVVSALLWGGAPADILIAARQRRLALFTSAVLIAELEEVLVRDKFAERISRIGTTVADLLSGYQNKEIARVCKKIGDAFAEFQPDQVLPVDVAQFVDQWAGSARRRSIARA